jgi:SAM-dependent methyltransferase
MGAVGDSQEPAEGQSLRSGDSSSWAGVTAAYARSFAKLCAGPTGVILNDLGSGSGGGLLDAGCGVGGFSRAAAGQGWQVTAVDSSPEMVAATRESFRGLSIDVRQESVLDLHFADGHFEVAVAKFVINHVPEPRVGVLELSRVVRSGGKVALTVWTNQRTAQIELFSRALENAGAVPSPVHRLPQEKDFERTVSGLALLAREAGLQPLSAREIRWNWDVTWDDLWAGAGGGIASIGSAYRQQDAAVRKRIESEMHSMSAHLEVNGVIRLPSVAAYVVAQKGEHQLLR